MKKLVAILALVLFAGSTAFAGIHDNSASDKSGTGSFLCTVYTPLTISDAQAVNLGTFVVSSTPYTTFDANGLSFTVNGEKNTPFFCKITEDETEDAATIVIGWTVPTTLDNDGNATVVGTVSSLTAVASGSATFTQIVEVSYNAF